uniref:Cytochrome n=1 Tax=Rhodnius prolixus TaxID=13249 RepID=T1H859_RHOPR
MDDVKIVKDLIRIIEYRKSTEGFIRESEKKFDYLKSLKQKYPRLTALWIVGIPVVIIHEPEDLEVIMGSPHHITKGHEYEAILPWLQEGLLVSTGEKWHKRRKLLTPTFHFRILEDNLQSINKHSRNLVRNMLNTKGEPIVAENFVTLCALDIICETAMGFPLNSQDNEGKEYVHAIKRISSLVVTKILKIWLRRNFIFYLTKSGKEFHKRLTFLHNFTEKIIRERKITYLAEQAKQKNNQNYDDEEIYLPKKRRAFLDSMIELDLKDPNLFTDKDIREEVDTFMFEEKVFNEVFELFGDSERNATLKDLQEMHYLEKVIKETLRMYPSVPYMSRVLSQDLKLSGDVIVPTGVNVVIVPYLVHRNPRFFKNPEVFDPDRFSQENCKNRHPFSYIPFSAGPRNCIGQKFAMMELKVVISTIVRFSKIETVTKPEELALAPLLILRSVTPIKIKVTPRNY